MSGAELLEKILRRTSLHGGLKRPCDPAPVFKHEGDYRPRLVGGAVDGGRDLKLTGHSPARPPIPVCVAETQFANPPSGARFMTPRSRMRELCDIGLGHLREANMQDVVPESDVLIATALWLNAQGAVPYRLSVAGGAGIDLGVEKQRVHDALRAAGIAKALINFESIGPDIHAVSPLQWWQVECKGAGAGKASTQRNNFDHALASVVSYFVDQVPDMFTRVHHLGPTARRPLLDRAIPF